MPLLKSVRASLLTAVLLCFLNAGGLLGDSRTGSFHMRTTEPVMVENTVLAPGSYLWTRVDSLANHNIVKISDEKTHHVTAMILAITSYRAVATSENEVDFWETPKGAPVAVRAWFSPGENYGQEFPYPAQLAVYRPNLVPGRLLDRATAPTQEPSPKAESSPKAVAPSAKGSVVQPAAEGSWAVISDGGPDASQRTTLVKRKQPNTIWNAFSKLPLTATLAPLIGIIGIVSLVLFLLSHLKRKKQQNLDSAA